MEEDRDDTKKVEEANMTEQKASSTSTTTTTTTTTTNFPWERRVLEPNQVAILAMGRTETLYETLTPNKSLINRFGAFSHDAIINSESGSTWLNESLAGARRAGRNRRGKKIAG